MKHTHILTKIGNSYRLTDILNKEHPTTIKDWQSIRPLLERRGILDSTQGLEILPDNHGHADHAIQLMDGAVS